ncbi:MAG: alpha/beta fold hydrolase [Myxococcota bacterium]
MATVDLGDRRLWYDASVAGDGDPVLLIQGVGAIGEAWRPQIDGLRDRFRLGWYDNRGIGQSGPPIRATSVEALASDARAVLDALGWDRAHVVGHSLGGVIAQQLALDAPARVRTLSLLCTFHRGRDVGIPSWRVVWSGLRSRVGTQAMRRRAFLELVAPRSVLAGDRDAVAAAMAPLFGRDLGDAEPMASVQLAALRAHDASARLAALASIPTLVVSADEDPIAPPVYGQRLAAAIGTARYFELTDASHACVIHRAADVNALLAGQFARG